MRQDKKKTLLDLLVQEFRLWQALSCLTRQERDALFESDAPRLTELAKHKSILLESIAARQQERRTSIQVANHTDSSNATELPLIAREIRWDDLSQEETNDLFVLAAGIQTLTEQIHEVVQGNLALADCSLKRLWAMQVWLDQETQISLPALLAAALTSCSVSDSTSPVTPPAIVNSAPKPVCKPTPGDLFTNLLTTASKHN